MHGLGLIALELIIAAAAIALLLMDLWVQPEKRRDLGYGAMIVVGGAFVATFLFPVHTSTVGYYGHVVLDPLAVFFQRLFLIGALGVLWMARESAEQFGGGIGEYYALVLFALVGMLFAASANSFLMLFVSMELIAISFYILTAFQRHDPLSLEAGIKYLIVGALAGGVVIYGVVLIYGSTGTLSFQQLAKIAPQLLDHKLLLLGLAMVFVGLGFKMAVIPFHLWVPDVYEGAPVPTTAFLAAGSKAAGLVLFIRLLYGPLHTLAGYWQGPMLWIGFLTVLVGSLCAIPQRNLKRLMGYSSILNAGFILLALSTACAEGVAVGLFYLTVYVFGVLGIFGVLNLIGVKGRTSEVSTVLALHQRAPWLAFLLGGFLMSLAGLPPFGGFLAKFFVFRTLLQKAPTPSHATAILLPLLLAVIMGFFFYLRVLYWAYFGESPKNPSAISFSRLSGGAFAFCFLGILLFGLMPKFLLHFAFTVAQTLPLH